MLPVQKATWSLCVREVCRRAVLCVLALVVTGLTATGAEAVTTKKVAVILFKPQNYGTAWVDPAVVRGAVWTDANSANNFYKEESFGKWALGGALRADGDVFGWYTVPYNNTGSCSLALWEQSAEAMAAKQGFVKANYDALIYVTAATGCPGRAWTGGKYVTVISGFTAPTIMHELGHAFGLGHASAWMCTDAAGAKVSISTTCAISEYGDYAVMGSTTSYHMNGFQKGALGFLSAANTKDVTASGTYALYPVEKASSYAQVLRIPRKYDSLGKVLDYYYLEIRETYGFDKFAATSVYVTGISVRVAPAYTSKGSKSFLLDTTSPTTTGFTDAPLKVGATFTDSTRRVKITPLSISGGIAQVRVDFY